MAITKEQQSDGSFLWTVYVNLRSSKMPSIRFQKRVKGLKSNAEALRVEKNLIKELSHLVAQKEGHGFTWRMVVDYWQSVVRSPDYSQKRYNPATIADYVSAMNRWTRDWLDKPASEIGRGEGRQVLDNVLRTGKSKGFQKRLKNTINMIYNFGIEERLIKGVHQSPVYGVQITIVQDKKPEILKVDEIRKLLFEAKSSDHDWYCVWAIALLTGMRNGELYALKWSDVDFDNDHITVQRSYNKRMNDYKSTKAGYWRTVPISGELKNLLLEIRHEKNEYVLPRIGTWRQGSQAKVLKTFCRHLGLPEIKFHTLRACFATQLISDGVEPIKVMKICGWQDLKTMARYIRLAGIDEKGVTDHLRFLPSEDALNGNVVNIHHR